MAEGYGALENVVILSFVRDGRVGALDFQVVAEFREEECVVRPFSSGRVLPPLNECIRRHEEVGVFLFNQSLTGKRHTGLWRG